MPRRDLYAQIASALVALGGAAVFTGLAMGEAAYSDALVAIGLIGMVGGGAVWTWLLATAPKAQEENVPTTSPPAPALRAGAAPALKPATGQVSERLELADNVTPAYLMALCEGRTDLQSAPATAIYIGTRITVSGTLLAASKVAHFTTVTIVFDDEHRTSAYLTFEQDHDRIKIIHKGDVLTANGKIERIRYNEILLEECRLV